MHGFIGIECILNARGAGVCRVFVKDLLVGPGMER